MVFVQECGIHRECADMTTQRRSIFAISAAICLAGAAVQQAFAQADNSDETEPQVTRQAEAVSRTVYGVIEKTQALMGEEKYEEACELLANLLQKDSLSEYERANLYQNLGFCLYSAGKITAAIGAFGEVLKIPGIEASMRKNVLYTLAQLRTREEQYEFALQNLEAWFELEPNPAPPPFILYAQNLYQAGRTAEMIAPIEAALSIAETRGMPVKENWYVLLNFAYFQQENYARIRDINILLLRKWPKKRYWLMLANAYRELNDESRFFSAYEVAYLQNMLESESELVTMAQLYLQNDVPFKAGRLLEQEIESGRIEESEKVLRLMSQAWSLAREDDRSIEPLTKAARMDDSGDTYIRLSNTYLNLGEYAKCVEAAKSGLAKGTLKNSDHAEISLGMCLYHERQFAEAIRVFRRALSVPRSNKTAKQWIRVLENEVLREEEIQRAEALADKKIEDLRTRRAADERS